MIFDEPFSGFDPVNADRLKQEILELKATGHTIIFSTHNMSSVEEICDEIALINRSEVVLSGNVKEVRERFKSNTYILNVRKETGGIEELRIRKEENISNSDWLTRLASQYEILSFTEEMCIRDSVEGKSVGMRYFAERGLREDTVSYTHLNHQRIY